MEIENFDTAEKVSSDIQFIDLDPKKNNENKKYFKDALTEITEVPINNLLNTLKKYYHNKAELNGFYPINEIRGIEEIYNTLWKPIKFSFPNLERRNNLVIGGSFQDKIFVSFISHLTGTFINEWLGVPPTNKTIYLRTCEAHQIKNDKIVKTYILIDIIDFLRQVGFWPINPSLGTEGMWPPPITGDGSYNNNLNKDLSLLSLNQALTMQRSLNIKPEKQPGLSKNEVRNLLLNHKQKKFWHPKMMWYGPSGIGTARELTGYVDHHQLPFRLTFKNRNYWKKGHFIEIGDGNYSMTGGWHSMQCIHGSKDWLGYEPTNKKIIMRVMDFYLHNEGLIRENWVPIDIAHILHQIDIDIFELIHKK
tara:strand:- start:179 stop:1270 length:1092 start_codon:yes stop_codon:yes gene_type:complete